MSLDESIHDERVLPERRHGTAAEVAWVLLFLDGLLLACTALFWILWGRFFDRGFYEAVTGGTWSTISQMVSPNIERVAAAGIRLAGFLGAIASVFVIVLSVTSFRRGERWAWYLMWALPALAVLDFALVSGYGALTVTSVVWDVSLLGLALISLALSYRLVFPNGTAGAPGHPSPA